MYAGVTMTGIPRVGDDWFTTENAITNSYNGTCRAAVKYEMRGGVYVCQLKKAKTIK